MTTHQTVAVAASLAVLYGRAIKPRNQDNGLLLNITYIAALAFWLSVAYTGHIWHV